MLTAAVGLQGLAAGAQGGELLGGEGLGGGEVIQHGLDLREEKGGFGGCKGGGVERGEALDGLREGGIFRVAEDFEQRNEGCGGEWLGHGGKLSTRASCFG